MANEDLKGQDRSGANVTFDPKTLSDLELLFSYTLILEELHLRKVVRTFNSPIGDYAEGFVAKTLGLKLMSNSNTGYDAEDANGIRYQIKCRRITAHNKSRQLSAIRNLEKQEFDFLIVVLFNERLEIEKVVKIPHQIIHKYAKFREHVHAHILHLRADILGDPLTKDLTDQFQRESDG
jgi:hypothetical protein